MSIENIERVWARVDDTDRREGMVAYENYHKLMKSIAAYYGCGFTQTVAAFVSLSPNNDYQGNLRSLVTVLWAINNKVPLKRIVTTAYNRCRDRAYEFARGEKDFLLETKGLKIRNFYCNIVQPEDSRWVTIDGHMSNVWAGEVRNMKKALLKNERQYDEIAEAFKVVAKKQRLLPNQLQGTLWFTWKRINLIRYDSQLTLFSPEDDCRGLKISPENIRPYV